MLQIPKILIFPKLILEGEVNFKGLPTNQTTQLYKLDWNTADESKYSQTGFTNFKGSSTETVNEWINSMFFALPKKYLDEIRHCSLKATEEWHRKKISNLATPTIAYVSQAFHLLSDCLYDSETNYWERTGNKLIAPFAMIYRFWTYQIEPKKLNEYVDLNTLKNSLIQIEKKNQETYYFGKYIIYEINRHIELLNEPEKKRKQNKIVKDGSLKNILDNTKKSVVIPDQYINFPDIGDAVLIKPKIKRTHNEFIIEAELKTNENISKFTNHIKSFQFQLIDHDKTKYLASNAAIINMSGTPPPVLTIIIENIEIFTNSEDFYIFDYKRLNYGTKEIKKINTEKIIEAKKDELKENGFTN